MVEDRPAGPPTDAAPDASPAGGAPSPAPAPAPAPAPGGQARPPPGTWQPPAHPAAWRWLRWVLPVLGGAALVVSLVVYEGVLEPGLYSGSAPEGNPLQWAVLAALAAAVAAAALAATRLPLRRYLVRAVGLEALGGFLLAGAWLGFLMFGGFGHCGLTPGDAQWSDAALYAAMPAPGTVAGHDVTWADPGPGLPFGRVIDPAWGPHNLTALEWVAEGLGAWSPHFVLGADRVLHLQVEGGHAVADVRARFLEWAAHATAADEATRAAWADAFVASNVTRHEETWVSHADTAAVPFTSYRLEVPGPFRLDSLHAGLADVGALTTDPGSSPGYRGQSGGPWIFGYSLGLRTLQRGADWADPGFYRLAVDTSGTVRFEGLSEGERPEASYVADVTGLLAEHGLPQPQPAAMYVGGSIC